MKNFAFIFARGGSKGLPGKNIKPLSGKPLIEYSISVAKSCPSIDEVFVSTDDPAISEISRQAGAVIIDRPIELASDVSPEWLSWRHAIKWVENNYGKFQFFVSLPATSPLRSVTDVENAIAKLNNALLREPSPKPSSANLFKHGGPSSNISTAFDFFTIIFSICSRVCDHSSYIE